MANKIRPSGLVTRRPEASAGILSQVLLLLLAGASMAAQQAQVNRSHRFGPNSCGPADPSYIRIANETGGQPMFLQRSEAGKALEFMMESSSQNHVTLFWATEKLEGARREFAVPVDSTLERITFSLSTDTKGTSMVVLHPSGGPVERDSATARVTELNCGRVVRVAKPDPGEWKIQVSGSGTFWLEAEGKSELSLVSAEFVAPGGRPGHEGLFRIAGQPLAGRPATLEIRLSDLAEKPAFELVSETGEVIRQVSLRQESAEDDTEYFGTFELPEKPFRVAVIGSDNRGYPYQRFFPSLFHASAVEIIPQYSMLDEVPGGDNIVLNYTVHNVGPPSTFRIIAADNHRYITGVQPKELSLESGASAKVTVGLAIPEEASAGTGVSVTVTATSTSDPRTTNGASSHFGIASKRGAGH